MVICPAHHAWNKLSKRMGVAGVGAPIHTPMIRLKIAENHRIYSLMKSGTQAGIEPTTFGVPIHCSASGMYKAMLFLITTYWTTIRHESVTFKQHIKCSQRCWDVEPVVVLDHLHTECTIPLCCNFRYVHEVNTMLNPLTTYDVYSRRENFRW